MIVGEIGISRSCGLELQSWEEGIVGTQGETGVEHTVACVDIADALHRLLFCYRASSRVDGGHLLGIDLKTLDARSADGDLLGIRQIHTGEEVEFR